MIKIISNIIAVIYKSVNDAIEHDGIEHAGYISFLLMLSIFPFLIFLMAATSFIGEKALVDILTKMILESSWAEFIDALKPRIVEITSAPPQGLLTIAILSAIWTASSIFEGLRTILNKSFRVVFTPPYILRRLMSFVEFLATIMIIIGFMLFLVLAPIAFKTLFNALTITKPLFIDIINSSSNYIRSILLYIFTFLIITYAYYALPSRKQKFIYVMPGAGFVMLTWLTFTKIFGYYLNYFPQVNFLYGSIAGIIVALLYFYFCSFIFIIGAELNFHLEMNYFKRRENNV